MTYIVVWKDAPGQLISTMATKDGDVLHYDEPPADAMVPDEAYNVFEHFNREDGSKLAVTPEFARSHLGWDDV